MNNAYFPVQIEKATSVDIAEISQIAIINLTEINSKLHSQKIIDHSCKNCSVAAITSQMQRKEIFVAKQDGKITGTGALANFGNFGVNRWCISNLFVDIPFHGKGVGTQLVNHIVVLAKEKGAQYIEVPSSRTAVGFYAKCGFLDENLPENDELTWMKRVL